MRSLLDNMYQRAANDIRDMKLSGWRESWNIVDRRTGQELTINAFPTKSYANYVIEQWRQSEHQHQRDAARHAQPKFGWRRRI